MEIGSPREIKIPKPKAEKPKTEGQTDIGKPDKYELFFRKPEIVQALLSLETDNFNMNLKNVVKVTAEELLYWGNTLQGAAHGLNRVFVASASAPEGLRMPFYARVRRNKMQIGRISDTYDISKYMSESYQKPHLNEPERVKAWLVELDKLGIRFEAKQGEQWKALDYNAAGELAKKIPATTVAEIEKGLEEAKKEYNESKEAVEKKIAEQEKAKAEHEKAEKEKVEKEKETTPVVPEVAVPEVAVPSSTPTPEATETPEQAENRKKEMEAKLQTQEQAQA